MKSTLFISDLTTVDYAYISSVGLLQGDSFNVSVYVSGEVTEDEKVVEDFGSVKKRIKEYIDHKVNGFDHKLWIDRRDPSWSLVPRSPDQRFVYKSDVLEMDIPFSAVKFYVCGMRVEDQLEQYLKMEMPNLDFRVMINHDYHLPMKTSRETPPSRFNYVHGLKDSTSWGCQNIAHGHHSFLYFASGIYGAQTRSHMFQEEVARILNETVFVKRENILTEASGYVEVAYTSRDRGPFYSKYRVGKEAHQLSILETETTIEFLGEYIRDFWSSGLIAYGVKSVYVSEGLMKGSFFEVES
jgi:6-pyruvoyl-tetrahydropterin synthase